MGVQVIARYPGIDVSREYQISWGWGVRPETHTVETTINHPPAADFGTLSLIDGVNGRRLDLPNCRVAKCSYPGDGRMVVHFEDFRWTWAMGSIDGDYNLLNGMTGVYTRQTSARELAGKCLREMPGVTSYNVDALPANAYPRKGWNAANPAQELELLANEYGLIVAVNPMTRRVTLCRLGVGADVPDGPQHQRLPSVYASAIPSQIRVVGASGLWQTAFWIGRPFARELDGSLVPWNTVSYAPAAGWDFVSPYSFTQIAGSTVINGERVYHKDLAAESVYRYYELASPWHKTPTPNPRVDWLTWITSLQLTKEMREEWQALANAIPAGASTEVQNRGFLEKLGPFLDTRLERDPVTNSRLPIVIRGGNNFEEFSFDNKSANGEWVGVASFPDPSKPVFGTSKPLFSYGGDGKVKPGTGRITVGHALNVDGVQLRYEKWLDNSVATPAGPMLEYHDDMRTEIVPFWSSNGGLGDGVDSSNVGFVWSQADYYLNAMAAAVAPQTAGTVQTPGLYLGRTLDGAIRRLVWSGGVTLAPTTTVARNNEPNPYVIPYENRPSRQAVLIAERVARRQVIRGQIDNRKAGIL